MQEAALNRRHFLRGNWREAMEDSSVALLQLTVADTCIAHAGVTCMACRDACDEDALRFRMQPGGISIPEPVDDLCTRCGDCQPVCPVAAITVPPAHEEPAHV